MSFAEFAKAFSGLVWGEPLAYLLTGAGLLFTIMTVGIQFKAITHGFNVIRGKYDNPEDEGNISHFQALCTALSATIGLGNISGVAVAVSLGGAGAVFWMWCVGFLGMATKFTTCSLGTMFRKEDASGTYRGGPMYYIELGLGKNWKPLALLFAFLGTCACIGAGNMFQSNQVSTIVKNAVVELHYIGYGEGLKEGTQDLIQYGVGALMCILAGLVILGGIKRIGAVTSKVVPLMCIIYVAGAFYVIVTNMGAVPGLIGSIFAEAFSGAAAEGAFFGVVVKTAILTGVKRACFSNEAGLGSAPMAHATAKTNEPIREGVVAAVGPFIDTLVICTMTALVVLITGTHARAPIGEVTGVQEIQAVGDEPAKLEVTLDVSSATEEVGIPRLGSKLMIAPKQTDENSPKATESIERIENGIAVLHVEVPADADELETFDEKVRPAVAAGSNAYYDKDGIELTAYSFDRVIPGFGTWFLPFAAFMFAFSTVISWGFYGETCVTYLLGEKSLVGFRIVYVSMVMVGAAITDLDPVLDFSDAMLGLMLIPNMIGTLFLAPHVMRATKDYFRRLNAGEFEEEVRRAAEAKARLKAEKS